MEQVVGGKSLLARFSNFLVYVGAVGLPMVWMPLAGLGGVTIEVPNVVSIVLALCLPIYLFRTAGGGKVHTYFLLQMLWTIIVLIAFLGYGTVGGLGVLREQFGKLVAAWCLALAFRHSTVKLSTVGIVALLATLVLLQVSLLRTGHELVSALVGYAAGGNRGAFVNEILRPAFNAFASENTGVVYVASKMNSVANFLVTFAIIAMWPDDRREKGWRILKGLVVGLTLALVFVLFSSSAVLVMAVFFVLLAARAIRKLNPVFLLLVLIAASMVVLLEHAPVLDFLQTNLGDDATSRSVRITQYLTALDAIGDHPLFGVGYIEIAGLPVHNWFLFSWSSAGIVAALLCVGLYLVLAFNAHALTRTRPKTFPVVWGLFAVFIVRTLVGGAGGTPDGPAVFAAAVIIGLRMKAGSTRLSNGRCGTPAVEFVPAARFDAFCNQRASQQELENDVFRSIKP